MEKEKSHYWGEILICCTTIILVIINMIWRFDFYSYTISVVGWLSFFLIMFLQFPKAKADREPKHYFGIVAGSLGLIFLVVDIFRHLMR